jgi:hypothetical protein
MRCIAFGELSIITAMNINIAVFWVVVLYRLLHTDDVTEDLTASIIRAMSKPRWKVGIDI